MITFEYGGAKITLKPATALNRMWLNKLRNLYPGYFDLPVDMKGYVEEALQCLYLVDKVDGDVGFVVPTNGDSTSENVKAFVDGLFMADESLYLAWITAIHQTRTASKSDPDLLPAHELTDDQKKVKKSNTSEKSSD